MRVFFFIYARKILIERCYDFLPRGYGNLGRCSKDMTVMLSNYSGTCCVNSTGTRSDSQITNLEMGRI